MINRHIGWFLVLMNFVVDALLITTAFNAAWWLRYIGGIGGTVGVENFVPLASYAGVRAGLIFVMLLVFLASGIYHTSPDNRFALEVSKLIQSILSSLGLLIIALFVLRMPFASRLLLGYSGILATIFLIGFRLIVQWIKSVLWQRGIGVVRVLVVGDGMAAQDVMRELLQHSSGGRQLWGCLTIQQHPGHNALMVNTNQPQPVPIHGSVADLELCIQTQNIRHVIIAIPGTQPELVQSAIRSCLHRHVEVRLVPEPYNVAGLHVSLDATYDRPLLAIREDSFRTYQRLTKRIFDIIFSLIVLFPFGLVIMALAAIAIKLDSRGPILFRQKRVTVDGSIFWVYKFRSMHSNAELQRLQLEGRNEKDGPIFKMRYDPRVTRIGKWLRRTSLDELPQLLNILKGEMSWVGPRPPLLSEVEAYEAWHNRRLNILPGLTGLWQVSGRSLLSFDEMVRLDLYYVENWSIWLDLKILIKTIPAVLLAKGAF
jgi:exopolysaccharide biosynthesis polyprenyl glycosylphosphotransferase